MKVEIIKDKQNEYKAGDIVSLTNGYNTYTFLLYEFENTTIGAISLENGEAHYHLPKEDGFYEVVESIVHDLKIDQWKVFDNDSEVKLILGKKVK